MSTSLLHRLYMSEDTMYQVIVEERNKTLFGSKTPPCLYSVSLRITKNLCYITLVRGKRVMGFCMKQPSRIEALE